MLVLMPWVSHVYKYIWAHMRVLVYSFPCSLSVYICSYVYICRWTCTVSSQQWARLVGLMQNGLTLVYGSDARHSWSINIVENYREKNTFDTLYFSTRENVGTKARVTGTYFRLWTAPPSSASSKVCTSVSSSWSKASLSVTPSSVTVPESESASRSMTVEFWWRNLKCEANQNLNCATWLLYPPKPQRQKIQKLSARNHLKTEIGRFQMRGFFRWDGLRRLS